VIISKNGEEFPQIVLSHSTKKHYIFIVTYILLFCISDVVV